MRKNFLFALVCFLALTGAQTVQAADEIYATVVDNKLTIYYDGQKASREGVITTWTPNSGTWNMTNPQREAITAVEIDASMAAARPTTLNQWFCGLRTITAITGLENLNTSEVTNMQELFASCRELKAINISNFNTDKVTTMWNMFSWCTALTELDLSTFNTQNVTNMSYMFCYCGALKTLDLSGFNTDNVKSMNSMFHDCKALSSINISSFSTVKVTDMGGMFANCEALVSVDLSKFVTNNVTSMPGMFEGCKALKALDLRKFNTGKVESFYVMFANCAALETLNIANFDMTNAKDAGSMFEGCAALKTIMCKNNWSTYTEVESEDMFKGCVALTGEKGTEFDETHTDIAYARPDGGTETPGYFTTTGTAIDNVAAVQAPSTKKIVKDGVLYLMYDGRMYDVRGAEIR